jgi:hypothetical protein
MAGIPIIHFALCLILVGAIFRVFEIKFKDSDNLLGSAARALTVVY